MQSYLALLFLAALARAGDVCLSQGGAFGPVGGTAEGWTLLDPTQACDEFQELTGDDSQGDLCDALPYGFTICGQAANLVSVEGAGEVENGGGCGVRLEIDGTKYPGRRLDEVPNDDPCYSTCNNVQVRFGRVIFEGVPMCG